MKYRGWLFLLLLAGVLGTILQKSLLNAQDRGRFRVSQAESRNPETEPDDLNEFMRSKLAMVHKIVEGLAVEDFSLIEKGARELDAIAESAAWNASRDPYYRNYSANFQHAARGLIEAAKSKSIEKATFSYVHVTISCTACHQHVRGVVRVAQ